MEPWKEELYHHGILGMKWGKRNGPPYPLGAGDHSTSEKKAGWRKSLDGGSGSSGRRASSESGSRSKEPKTTGISLRMRDRKEARKKLRRDVKANVKSAKGVVNKASELVGHGFEKTYYENRQRLEANLKEHSKSKRGKKLHTIRGNNAGYAAEYHQKVRSMDLGEKLVEEFTKRELMGTNVQRLSGRTTTYGKQAVDQLLTFGLYGVFKDLAYESTERALSRTAHNKPKKSN